MNFFYIISLSNSINLEILLHVSELQFMNTNYSRIIDRKFRLTVQMSLRFLVCLLNYLAEPPLNIFETSIGWLFSLQTFLVSVFRAPLWTLSPLDPMNLTFRLLWVWRHTCTPTSSYDIENVAKQTIEISKTALKKGTAKKEAKL